MFGSDDMMENTLSSNGIIAKWPPRQPGGIFDDLHGIIVIIEHQNIGVDITFSVLSYLIQKIWRKIHYLVMVERKMAAMSRFCDGSISENVQGAKLYMCTKAHAFILKSEHHFHISPGLLKLYTFQCCFWFNNRHSKSKKGVMSYLHISSQCGGLHYTYNLHSKWLLEQRRKQLHELTYIMETGTTFK